MIWDADGLAQVLLHKNTFKKVVGMTGDGVNDAHALSAAQWNCSG